MNVVVCYIVNYACFWGLILGLLVTEFAYPFVVLLLFFNVENFNTVACIHYLF